ncbi:Asr1405/Asl0597 family protein [Crocosphaera sp. Alani8]|uniref:Asr1405/Asl0597 family protein n=1 Tax=Crocosphaera sp. Alani8 TaxID=3038952 RepID=UPI00313D82A6
MQPYNSNALISRVEKVSRCDRWTVYQRLQELTIPCWCPEDGYLWVGIENGLHAILLRSVVYNAIAPRQELITWLERCWETVDYESIKSYQTRQR